MTVKELGALLAHAAGGYPDHRVVIVPAPGGGPFWEVHEISVGSILIGGIGGRVEEVVVIWPGRVVEDVSGDGTE